MKFKRELAYIKEQKVKNIVDTKKNIFKSDESFQEISSFKKEIDGLMKDVYFDVYDRYNVWEKNFIGADLEESLDKLLDGKILDLIKEKDYLLLQKDSIILSIEERNKKTLKDIINKVFFVLVEKDKILKEKDLMINDLKSKIKEVENINLEQYIHKLSEGIEQLSLKKDQTSSLEKNDKEKKLFYSNTDFINVNSIGWK